MMELGLDAPEMHREAGREIAGLGIDALWGVRGLAGEMVAAAREYGIAETAFFESSDDAAVAAIGEVREGDLILVKGSRSVETDKIVRALRDRFPLAGVDR
jgi:UDP-N-acetylmuramoyl-tripeptide--D-alanyl-D-alanine ligase